MILDIPSSDDFMQSGIDFLNIAWVKIIKLLLDLEENKKLLESEKYNEEDEEDELTIKLLAYSRMVAECTDEVIFDQIDIDTDQYWKKAQRILATSLSLIQQGTEFILKGYIAQVSPFLLLSRDSSNWTSKSQIEDISFSEFKTIDAHDLIKVYNAVAFRRLSENNTIISHRLPEEFKQRFEKLRNQRNKVMHSVDKNLKLTSKDLLVEILEISHHLIRPQSWIKTRNKLIRDQPESEFFKLAASDIDFDYYLCKIAIEIDLVIKLLQPSDASKYFSFEKQRSYICPNCYDLAFNDYYEDYTNEIPKLAQLKPNKPNSTTVYCLLCNQTSKVSRNNCNCKGCHGNVISDSDICMTCGNQFDES